MAKFKASSVSKGKNRSQKNTRSKPGLALPRQIAAELTALGHPVEASSRGKTQKPRRGVPPKANLPHKKPARFKPDKPQNKPVVTNSTSTTKPSPPASSNTALGRLLARQEAPPLIKSRKRKLRSSEEDLEDARIAWLERELGVRDKAQGKSKLRQEFEEDGLEDLFDGLEELDKLADRLREPVALESVDGEHQSQDEQGSSVDESEWSGCHIDMEMEDEPLNTDAPSSVYEVQDKLDNVTAEDDKDSAVNPSQSTSTSKRYVPPHLRQKDTPAPNTKDGPTIDPRLRRQLMGILNRVSPTTVPTCLESLRGLYTDHARAIVTEGLVQVILELVGTRDELGAALAVTYSATIAAISRGGVQVSGVEIGWAPSFVASLICRLCEIYENHTPVDHGKAGPNLLGFLSHLYFFQVIGCPLVYDFVRLLINEGLNETRVEGLMVLLKNAGPRLRYDDPVALKEIVQMAQAYKREAGEANSRTNFMFETLQDLKNNKIRKEAQASTSTVEELKENLKKYLAGLAKKSSTACEPLQLTLKDLKEADKRGKWWLIGAAWDGDPLLELNEKQTTTNDTSEALAQLARQQGMNTDVRRSIFTTLMSAEDYVDASEKLNSLGLTAVQQREIVRVLLHCLGHETMYNPYYTLVGQKLASDSHSIQITFQFALWDFFRDLGETEVGGREMLKGLSQSARDSSPDRDNKTTHKKVVHLASAYGWWIAKGCLSITVLKTLPFSQLQSETTRKFLIELLARTILSLHSTSPSLAPSTIASRIDRVGLERIFGKARGTEMGDGLVEFLESAHTKLCDTDDFVGNTRLKELIQNGQKTVIDVLSSGVI